MKISYLSLVIALLLLQSCQHKNHNVASFNTKLGLAYLKQGNRPLAKRKLMAAQVEDANSPDVNAAIAWFMEQSGEIAQAQIYYRKAISCAPGDGRQLNNYGAFLCRQGQYKEANNYFMQAVEDVKYEHTAGAYENAGLCAEASKNYRQARIYFLKALEHDPSRQQSSYELRTKYSTGELNNDYTINSK